MGLGMFDTCDNSLMVYIFGPQRSRPFTQSVHSFVGAGFVAGILLSKPFLPEQKSPSGDVCPNHNLTEIGISNDPYISPDDPPKEVLNPTAQNLCFFWKNARLLILKRLSKVTAPPKRNARCENIENSAKIEIEKLTMFEKLWYVAFENFQFWHFPQILRPIKSDVSGNTVWS